ncbi:activin receptor type-2A [Galendromus occidentalis]|uniref:Serine/threonine-protein kinase receptor n=1 Tax=Galendromus occidentalis TaxID=34638 RepID=A0AAJ7L7I7_9ACAR|nr:activin receptor type-2A [Galendromus occidentalis]
MPHSYRYTAGVPQLSTKLSVVILVAAVVATVPRAVSADQALLRCAFHNITVPVEDEVTEDCKIETPGHGPSFCFVLFSRNKVTQEYEASMRGCWQGGENQCVEGAHRDPDMGACYNRKNNGATMLFCCCLSSGCNRDFSPLPPMQTRTEDEDIEPSLKKLADRSASKALETGGISFIYIILAIGALGVGTSLTYLSVLGFRKHRQIKDAQMHFGYDNKFSKGAQEHPGSMLQLDNVSLFDLAAQGRFGAVYRGRVDDTQVAVKIFPAGERQSWEKELEVYRLPQMEHANILSFFGTGTKINPQTGLTEYWLLTTWHEQGSLYDFLCRNTITYEQLLLLADSIAKGVMHIHTDIPASATHGYKPAMAHRDIKSRNIILKDESTACIADFGLAIVFESGANIGEVHGQVGTRRYMAPEVLEGAISFDQEAFQRIDMYAVSLVLWEMLSRTKDCDPFPKCRMPFEDQVGQHPTLEDMQETVVNRKSRPPIRESWRQNSKLSLLISTLEECWDADADARLSACTVHERLQYLIGNLEPVEKKPVDSVDSECTALLQGTESSDTFEMQQMP